MTVQAQWATALVVDDSDPLQNMDIADIAKPIDLSRPSAEIFEEIKASLDAEAYLWRVPQVRCDMKQGDTAPMTPPCATCPKYTAPNLDQPLSRLCKVGREQAALMIEHDMAVAAERQAEEVHGALDEELEAALELAEVALA